MKKLDKLLINSFIGPFVLTFLVVVFILLMQHMLKYFDDLVGKDLGWDVLGKLLFYFAIFMTPVALPLGVLLSSLITFGNLGEHFELTAIKSSGVSLLRALQPLFFAVLALTGVAFYINNNLVPKAALEAYSLLYDIKQKKPALDIREGAFYVGIPDISIKISKKFPKDVAALKGVVIYDHRRSEGNKQVTIADSGRMYTILNERYLKLELYDGYNYDEGGTSQNDLAGQKGHRDESLSRTRFQKTQMVFDLSSFDMHPTDKKWFQGNRIMRNISELNGDVDSIRNEVLSQQYEFRYNKPNLFTYFRRGEKNEIPQELVDYKKIKDSLNAAFYTQKYNSGAQTQPAPTVTKPAEVVAPPVGTVKRPAKAAEKVVQKSTDNVKKVTPTSANSPDKKKEGKSISKVGDPQAKNKERIRKQAFARRKFQEQERIAREKREKQKREEEAKKLTLKQKPVKKINRDSLINHIIDSVVAIKPTTESYQSAANSARQAKGQLESSNNNIETYVNDLRIFEIQWHKILASSMACIAMFLIGAPLGSIIKKGGLGIPVIVSIFFFIVYYVLNILGEKWAKAGTLDVISGVWMADVFLLVIGLLFLRQARLDARLFDADSYLVQIDKFKRWWQKRKGVSNVQPNS